MDDPDLPATAPAPPDAAARPAAIDRGIAAWVAASVHNSPLSADTAAYNHLVTVALPRLRDAILKEV